MKMVYLIIIILIFLISCQSKDQMMAEFVTCVNNQVGKTYLEQLNAKGPDEFSNAGLIWYCRDVAGFPKISTIYVSWKNVKVPKVGAYVYGIIKENGPSVTTDLLGVIVSINPTMVVAGDQEKNILTKHLLELKKNYIRVEYLYVDI